MNEVLKELYRKQKLAPITKQEEDSAADYAISVLRRQLSRQFSIVDMQDATRRTSSSGSTANEDKPDSSNTTSSSRRGSIFDKLHTPHPSLKEIDESIQTFGTKASQIPGFEDLEKRNPKEILFWTLILVVLIALTGYSFIRLIMDYLEHPTRTSVMMQYYPQMTIPVATLCIPFHIDRIPYAKPSANFLYSWKDTSESLKNLLMEEQNLSSIFSCPHRRVDQQSSKELFKARLLNEYGKTNQAYGRVEIFLNGMWGSICNTNWDHRDAKVICKMITGKYLETATTLHALQGVAETVLVWMNNVECSGSEDNIGMCEHSELGEAECSDLQFAAVDCTGKANPDPWRETDSEIQLKISEKNIHKGITCSGWNQMLPISEEQNDLEVRLKDPNGIANSKWGTLEVLHNGMWGAVSAENWQKKEAAVVCRMLGWAEGSGEAFEGSLVSAGRSPTWMRHINCIGNESSLLDCSYSLPCLMPSENVVGVDCTGNAHSHLEKIMRNFTISRTAAALLARITAFETWNLVSGETPASFKWSASPTYPAGNYDKEIAIGNLLSIMEKSGKNADLKALRDMLSCGLCNTLNLQVSLQKDKFTRQLEKVLGCEEPSISWVEDSESSHSLCFQLPLHQTDMRHRESLVISLDFRNLYDTVDWSSEAVRDVYSMGFKIDFSGGLNAERETLKTVELRVGEEHTIAIDVTAYYNLEEAKNCYLGVYNCELMCMAKAYRQSCGHLCTPFTWEKLSSNTGHQHFCLLEDYRQCYHHVENISDIISHCSDMCKQPCHHTTHLVRRLKTRSLGKKSATRIFIKLDSEVYPEFTEEKAVTWYGLMGDLGGVIGLWLGASFVGVLHFVWYIVYDVIWMRKKVKALTRQVSQANVEWSSNNV